MTDEIRADIKILFALTLVHFTGDFYSSFINPLYPLFVQKLGLSLAQIGIISGVNRLLAFIVQPSVGYLADRYSTRHFILLGVLMPVIFIPLSGITCGFWTFLTTVALGSIGSSMFHPSVTGMIPVYAGNKTGFAMSVFNTGGTLAFGVGPLAITWYASRFGLGALPFTVVFGLLVSWYLYRNVPVPQGEGLRGLGFLGSIKYSLGSVWKPILCIWIVMVVRAVTGQSFSTFMPVLFVQRGYSVVSAGAMFSLFTVSGTVSGLISGHLSDRIGFKPIFIFAFVLMSPMLVLFLNLQGHWVYMGAILAGAISLATMPLGVAMAQVLAPKGRSMVASLMMGFAFGLGGAVTAVVGKLADIFSIHGVLMGISLLPLLSLPLIFTLPDVKK
ncbi:MAG: MFS transporter [Deltaproteobacteria bacterium]|nr:MFS transporter [Deltaproteobacteria bacterium]